MGLGPPDRPLGETIQQARKGKASHPDKAATGERAVRLGREIFSQTGELCPFGDTKGLIFEARKGNEYARVKPF